MPREGVARLEWIRLADGPRRLELDLELGDAAASAVSVTVAGRALGEFPLTDPLRLALPADLPRGKISVDLTVRDAPERNGWGVVAGALTPAAPPGELVHDGDVWRQSGWSALDFYLRVENGQAVVGRFEPPASPRAGQSFELVVERESGEPLGGFQWNSTLLDRWRGARAIQVPLGGHRGLLRVRLLASGEGPAASWRSLAVSERASPPPQASAPGSSVPPRLLVLCVFDALRADHGGQPAGAAASTPTFERLASEGLDFRDHWSVAPNTLPSTTALLTGEHPHVESRGRMPSDGSPTLAERLHEAGYRTALVSGNPFVGPAFGTDRGFGEFISVAPAPEAAGGAAATNDHAARVYAAALDWLARLAPGERAFVYLHVLNPHNPYAPPADYLERGTAAAATIDGSTETLLAIRKLRREVTAAEIERLRGLYRASVTYADAELGRFLAELARRVPPQELVLALTADHGEELFDHGGVLHGYTLYDELLRIPLTLWSPGRLAPSRVEMATDTLDLYRTLLELGGARAQAGAPGRDLLRLATISGRAGRPQLAAAASLEGGIYSARSPRFKLVWAPRTGLQWGMGEGLGRSRDAEYLFDLVEDRYERVNRAGELDFEAEYLRGVLDAWLAAERLRGPAARGEAPTDPEVLERLRALGYL